MLGVLLSILAGALMALQGVLNTRLTEKTSTWVSNAIVHGTGFMFCIVAWFISGRPSFEKALHVENKVYYLGGILGAMIVYAVVKGMSSLGPAAATMIILIAQLLLAYVIELFGLFGTEIVGFEFRKLVAIGIMVIGIIVFKY